MTATTTDRMPPLPPDQLTPAQQDALAQIVAGPRGAAVGPFVVLLRSPELMNRLQRVGEYLRYDKALEARLFELAVLLVARHWDQAFEWAHHHPLALAAGLDPDVVAAVGDGRRPDGMDGPTQAVWELLHQLHTTGAVDDDAYADAVARLGEAGVVEVVAAAGYYTTLAMLMNVARTPPQDGARLPARTGTEAS